MAVLQEEYLVVPAEKLAPSTLEALIEEFVLREGTDYGHSEVTLEGKCSRVRKQLEAGHILIVFSQLTQNTTLLTRDQYKKIQLEK